MNSYDRLFPNQDVLPEGGFGNLIALPLQREPRNNGNSVFVDESFTPFFDQWDYLASVKKLTVSEVDSIMSTYCVSSHDMGEISTSSESHPWEPPKTINLKAEDIPDIINVTIADKVYIPIKGMAAPAISTIRRIASFSNPAFYQKQAMRLSTYNTHRIISCAELSDDYLILPRGCEDVVVSLFPDFKVICTVDDKTNHGSPIKTHFKGELRLNQKDAVTSMSQYRNGVLSASTAFGKTVTAIGLIAERQVNTLILVHTKSLLEQWHKRLEEFLDVEYEHEDTSHKRGPKRPFSPFGRLGSGVNTMHGMIDIALIQSCYGEDEVKPFVKDYGMLIVDECHHISAVNFERVVKGANAKYVYGLTATPIRKDGLQPIIFMQCGPIRYDSSKSHLPEASSFRKILVPRFTPFRSLDSVKVEYSEICAQMAVDEYRNRIIVADVARALSDGRTPLILTSRKDHLYTLQNMLLPICTNTITLVGSDSKRDKDEAMKRLREIPSDEPMILIAIGKYVGEGFDFPRLDTLFLVIPVSWKGVVAQYVGRLHRGYDGKKDVKVFDYIDIHVQLCDLMYKRRLRGYSAEGYQTMSDPLNADDEKTTGIIHDGSSYLPPLSSDIVSARNSIVISSPKITLIRPDLQSLLQSKTIDGISVTIVAKDFAPTQNIMGANVIINSNLTLQSVIIDKQILWYGNVNPIGYNAQASSVIRLKDTSISAISLDTVFAGK